MDNPRKIREQIPVFENIKRREVRISRSATVLPAWGKVYEKLLNEQVTEYVDPKLMVSHHLVAYKKNNG